MHITEIELTNFRSYNHIRLAFDQPRTLVVGENGAGKSTIIDAIALATTGLCRGVNAKGEGQRELIRAGADEAQIKLSIEGMDPVIVTINGKHGTTRNKPVDMVLGQLRTTKPMATAVIYGSTFFDMNHADAKALLMRLLNVKVAVPADKATTEGGTELIDLDEVDRRYKIAFDNRAGAKRELLASHVPVVTGRADLEKIDADDLGQQVRDAKMRYEAAVAATADVRATCKQLTEEQGKLGQPDLANLRTKLDTHQTMLSQHEQQAKEARAVLAKAEEKAAEPIDALNVQVNDLKLFMRRIDGHTKTLKTEQADPLEQATQCVLGNGIPCLTPAKEFTAAIDETKKQIAAIDKRIKAGTKRAESIAAANQSVKDADKHVAYHKGQVDTLTKAIADGAAAISRWNEIAQELMELQPALAGGESQIESASATLAKVQTTAQELAAYNLQIKQREAAQDKHDDLTQEVKDLEAMVKLLGPTGARATALQTAVDDFHQAINAALSLFKFELAINVDPWLVRVKHPNTTHALPFELLSKGQRIWTGLAFQMALAAVSGLDFCVVDDAEGVVGQAMQMMTGLVMNAPVGQVIVVKAQADGVELPSVEGLQAVRISESQPALAGGVSQ